MHYNLDPETYIAQDLDDPRERLILPEELQSHPVNPQASHLMPDPKRKQNRSDNDGDEDEDDGNER